MECDSNINPVYIQRRLKLKGKNIFQKIISHTLKSLTWKKDLETHSKVYDNNWQYIFMRILSRKDLYLK